ncbi:hypothetical protein V6Z11_A07G099200 [Gossypium hirsutum]
MIPNSLRIQFITIIEAMPHSSTSKIKNCNFRSDYSSKSYLDDMQ